MCSVSLSVISQFIDFYFEGAMLAMLTAVAPKYQSLIFSTTECQDNLIAVTEIKWTPFSPCGAVV